MACKYRLVDKGKLLCFYATSSYLHELDRYELLLDLNREARHNAEIAQLLALAYRARMDLLAVRRSCDCPAETVNGLL